MSPSGLSILENKDFYYVDEDGERLPHLSTIKNVYLFLEIKIILQNVLLNQRIEKTKLISINLSVVIYIQ